MISKRILVIAGVAVAVLLLVTVVIIGPSDFFLPEQSTQVAETPVDGDAETVKQGMFVGAAGHTVTGTVRLQRDSDGLFLWFENYSQTQGPDVFVYVTPSPTPDTKAEITAGTKIRIDGGADNGESTKEGSFTQRLPDAVTATDINGVGIWCERFATPFGYAELTPMAG